jgi:hypothetical protein
MKCPSCNKRAIGFVSWASGKRWIRWQCPHCGVGLKASRRTIKVIIGFILLLPFIIWAGIAICRAYNIQEDREENLVFAAIMIPVLTGLAFWDWKTGSYARRDN